MKFKYIKNGKILIRISDGRKQRPVKRDLTTLRKILTEFTEHTATYKNTYFWQSPSTASSRRSLERKSRFVGNFEPDLIGINVTLEFELSVSCRYIYTHKNIVVNGSRVTARTITTIHKEIDAILAAYDAVLEAA